MWSRVGIPGRGHCYGPKWGRQLGVQKEGQTGLLNGTDPLLFESTAFCSAPRIAKCALEICLGKE